MRRRWLLALLLLAACHPHKAQGPDDGGARDAGVDGGPVVPAYRCDVDLSPFIDEAGHGAFVRAIQDRGDLLTGSAAQGKLGDYLLGNAAIRVIVQGPDRHLGPQPFGGNIIDAALTGPGMHDEFGEVGLFYNFGRTVDAQHMEVLRDGSQGGTAVLAASGPDALNDWVAVKGQLAAKLGAPPVTDPDVALPLRITNYFLLSPSEKRVREITAFCNDGSAPTTLSVGDFTDPGGAVEFFNPDACVHGFGYANGFCFGLDPLSWYGYLGDGVAYGYAPYHPGSATQPEESSEALTVAGVTGSILGAPGLPGLLAWFEPDAGPRAGALTVPAGGSALLARDFIVGRDLGEVASIIARSRAQAVNRTVVALSGKVTDPAGSPIAGARVAAERNTGIGVETVFTTDASGAFGGTLNAGSYALSAWAPGRAISARFDVSLTGQPVVQNIALGDTHALTVKVASERGDPLPAKVTLLCSGPCPAPSSKLDLYTDVTRDPLPDDVQVQGFVPPSGTATFFAPPGQYQVVVSRGPAYSIFPATFPAAGAAVDLRSSDQSLSATLVRVVDTTGWLASDFHVHAINSPDAYVPNLDRVLAYLGEGMEVLVSTDHDFVTDLAPYNAALGGQGLMATVIGEECSPMAFGHYILYPYPRVEGDLNGGALDWAGGGHPTDTLSEMFSAARKAGAGTIQFNHPRGFLGGFSYLKVDLDTLASHAPPEAFRMAPPHPTAADTGLMSGAFDSIELMNPGVDSFDPVNAHALFNDWFTLLSEGVKVTGTGVSDTHQQFATAAGYWRTWVQAGVDRPGDLLPSQLSAAVNAMHATVSDGPFMKVTAHRLDALGGAVGPEVGPGGTVGPGAGDVEVTVDVQVPTYMSVDRIELFTHVPADDGHCPIDPASATAATERVACNGEPSLNWPASSVLATRTFTLSPADLETVATVAGAPVQRYHHLETFTVPAPATDNWLVAFVYGSSDLFPLVYRKVDGNGNHVPAAPFALSNPIFLDADGNGYDHPPFTPGAPRPAAPAAPPPAPDRLRGLDAFFQGINEK